MKCSKCGKEIKEGEQFCSNCGTKVKSQKKSMIYKNDSGEIQQEGKKSWKILLIVLAIIISIGIVMAIAIYNKVNKLTNLSEENNNVNEFENSTKKYTSFYLNKDELKQNIDGVDNAELRDKNINELKGRWSYNTEKNNNYNCNLASKTYYSNDELPIVGIAIAYNDNNDVLGMEYISFSDLNFIKSFYGEKIFNDSIQILMNTVAYLTALTNDEELQKYYANLLMRR